MQRDDDSSDNYYSVAIAQSSPWSKQTLTYASHTPLSPGDIVEAPLGKKTVLGVVLESTDPPKDLLHVIKYLTPVGHSLPKQTLQLYNWIERYYPASGAGHANKFLPQSINKKMLENHTKQNEKTPETATLMVTLTDEQQRASKKMLATSPNPVVLHGITGSGKTAIYASKIISVLMSGKHALIVVPEISLISQLASSIETLISECKVITYHSNQSPKKSREAWLAARNEDTPKVFVGTRSSLFLPYSSLGVVVVDEAHEHSLKEDHENSHYHGLFVAGSLAKIHEAQYIVGSATPPIPETELMIKTGATLICLHSIAKTELSHNNTFEIIDLNKQDKQRKQKGLLSKPIQDAIAESLNRNEQTLLFINKLGSAHIIECDTCGWRATCPRCDTNFVYHHDEHRYRCNVCGLTKSASNVCEDCAGKLTTKSLAIKSVETEVSKLFPTARIARFDSTNKKAESISELYEKVHKGEVDIIIGTQLMAKGFDFPFLSTVGVINADTLLSLPDINAEERLFAQLVQVAGRVGRGHRDSRVLIQTRQAQNPLFRLVQRNDWHEIYDSELVRRKKHHYPPNVYLAKITIKGSSELIAKNRAHATQREIPQHIVVSEPFKAFYYKRNNTYYWQILCKSKQRNELVSLASLRNKYIDIDFDPVTLL